MGGWDLSTCNNVKIITPGRGVQRYPARTPIRPAAFQRVFVKKRRATENRAHLNDTGYWAFVAIQEETPLRIPGFCLCSAYYPWLGKASRSQTLTARLPTKSDPVCLCAFGNVSLLRLGCIIFPFTPPPFHFGVHVTLGHCGWFLPILFCELPVCSQWISHTTCRAYSHLLSAVVFFLQFST